MSDVITLNVKSYTDKLLDNPMIRGLLKDKYYSTVDSWGFKTEVFLNDDFTFKLRFDGDDLVLDLIGDKKTLPQIVAHRIFNIKGRMTSIRLKRDQILVTTDGLGEHKLANLA